MEGLVKIANDYKNDPALKAYNDNYAKKEEEYIGAAEQRNPDLVEKENRAVALGTGIGAGVGAVGGTLAGAALGAGSASSLVGKAVTGVIGGAAGGMTGVGVGHMLGGIASLPAVHYQRSKEDPEVMKNYYQKRNDLVDAYQIRDLAENNLRQRYQLEKAEQRLRNRYNLGEVEA